tara:strand:+ start:387 stop:1616 length:1230 start_codon:yes stop_codon:yes gene_type:complete
MRYTDIVKPSTFANDSYFQALSADIRKNDPLAWIETESHKPFWVVSKHSDILEIERQNDKFLNTAQSVLQTKKVEKQIEESGQGQLLRTLIHMDEPDHKKFRALTKEWFMPINLRKIEARIKDLAKKTVDHMREMGGELDFVSDVAVWFPLRVIMMILGVPPQDEPLMLKLTQELFGAEDPDLQRKAVSEEDRMQTIMEFFAYFSAMTEDRRKRPGDDVASVIANATVDGKQIGDLEAMSYYIIIATAGHDTTSSAAAGGLQALASSPLELKKMIDDPSISNLAVEEAIRWVSPVKHFMRYATENYSLRNKEIKIGDALMMLYPSGNRDEEVFQKPQKFIADRKPNRHLAFGFGAHHCLGNLLAKLELKFLYEELFSRIKNIELAGEAELVHSNFVSGLKTLPIRVSLK